MKDQAPNDTRPASLLLDEDRKRMLAHLSPMVVNAYAGEYAEAFEFEDKETVRYLDENLILSMSKDGFRSKQVVEMSNAKQADMMAMERMSSPTYDMNTGQKPKDKATGGGLFSKR